MHCDVFGEGEPQAGLSKRETEGKGAESSDGANSQRWLKWVLLGIGDVKVYFIGALLELLKGCVGLGKRKREELALQIMKIVHLQALTLLSPDGTGGHPAKPL